MIWPRAKFSDRARSLRTAMGSVTSALNRSRNTVVQLTSEPAAPPRVASRKPRTFKSRTKATTAATVEVRKLPPVSGAWEGSSRPAPAAAEMFQELSDVLMPSETEERALELVLSPPRRSRSACEYNLVFVYIIIYIHIKKYNHGRGKENIDYEMLLFLVLFI